MIQKNWPQGYYNQSKRAATTQWKALISHKLLVHSCLGKKILKGYLCISKLQARSGIVCQLTQNLKPAKSHLLCSAHSKETVLHLADQIFLLSYPAKYNSSITKCGNMVQRKMTVCPCIGEGKDSHQGEKRLKGKVIAGRRTQGADQPFIHTGYKLGNTQSLDQAGCGTVPALHIYTPSALKTKFNRFLKMIM